MSILSCAFYLGDTVQTAQRLLGKYVVRMLDGRALVARITETEAYVGRMDKTAKPRVTPRCSARRAMRMST